MYKVGVILYLKTIHVSNRREQLHFLPLRGEHLVSLEAPTHPPTQSSAASLLSALLLCRFHRGWSRVRAGEGFSDSW